MSQLSIRFFDFLFSIAGILILIPVFLVISVLIKFSSKGNIVFTQKRVGKDNRDFILFKFRTMRAGADQTGLITVGERDSRITSIGYFLRKTKLDELPQLFNVLLNDMSLVGPRPEVRKYVDLYTKEQMKVLSVKPGITDYASMVYKDENALLGKAGDPEEFYVKEIMPRKIMLNMKYMNEPTVKNYFSVIFRTLAGLFG